MATAGEHRRAGGGRPHAVAGRRLPGPRATPPPTRSELDGLDLVFLALPHGQSQHLVPGPASPGGRHGRPGRRLPAARRRRSTRPGTARSTWPPSCWTASSTACPSSHRHGAGGHPASPPPAAIPTAAILALAPLVRAGAILAEPDRAADHRRRGQRRLRGRPGAEGRTSTSARSTRTSSPTACSTTATPPRWSRASAPQVLFTPHLAPMVRGILATCYARPAPAGRQRRRRRSPPPTPWPSSTRPTTASRFVVVTDGPPSTKATSGSNCAHVTVRVDPRTGWVVAICRHRQPGQGGGRPGRPVRQPGPRAARGRPGSRLAGVYP